MLSIFSCGYCPFVCILWRNVYLDLLPIFWLSCLFYWYWAAWAACIFWRLSFCQFLCLQLFYRILRTVFILFIVSLGFPSKSVVKIHLPMQEMRLNSWVEKIPWSRKWQPSPVFLPGNSLEERTLVGYIVHGVAKESDRTYQLNSDKKAVISFAAQKLLSLIRSYLFIFIPISLGGGSMRILLWFMSRVIWPSNPTSEHNPEKTIFEKDTDTPMFIAALFIIARIWKQPRSPSTEEWTKKFWCISMMEY